MFSWFRRGMKTPLLIVCLLLLACTSEHPSDSIRIGVNFPLTGGLAVYGQPLLEGFTLGLEEVNAARGVHGKPLQIIVEDNAGDPRTAIQAAQKLMDSDQVHLMITTMVGPTGAIVPLTEKEHLPLLYAAATDGFADKNQYVFKDSVDAYYDCQLLGQEALKRGMKRVALFGTLGEFTEDCKRALQEDLTGQGELVLYDTYSKGDTDFRTELTKLQSKKPDVVFLSLYADDCMVLWQQIQELNVHIPFMLPFSQSGCGEERAMASMQRFPGAIIALDFIVDKQGKEYRTFITHFRERFHKEPDMPFFTILAYDWAHYLALTFEKCIDPSDRECLKKALEQVDYTGALGEVLFKPTHATFRPRIVIEYQNGNWMSLNGEKGLSVS